MRLDNLKEIEAGLEVEEKALFTVTELAPLLKEHAIVLSTPLT